MNVHTLIKLLNPIKRFLRETKGAAAIEFLLTVMFLVLVLFFMMDLAITRATVAQLDNISYSLVTVLRERTQLYRTADGKGKVEAISESEVKPLKILAKAMYYGNPNDSRPLYLVIQSLQFKQTSATKEPVVDMSLSQPLGDTQQCVPTTNLLNFQNIAPRSEQNDERTIPLYQVTVCVPAYSVFRSLVVGPAYANGTLRSSSHAVGR
ncbi:tight adherence pilus pseudopilin TadF [Actinobacillus delphinicola]|uniref:Tight adherence protein F n=1 Tax=Actinobacillus delphinicola TaxID=51161 RepID=A0A448TS91_9PAST|nr:tight adherence pilus pseudopilin TadF [Actinobacillus delphinicola]VEJ08859.1 tight adherence protein F [Actinobacillus delphinicola]